MSFGMFLFGNAYSVLLKSPLIVLLFFLLKVLLCSGVFGSSFLCDPVIRIFGERWTGGSAFCFPSFLSSFAERFLEIFDLVLGQVQKGCFLVIVASALTCISSMSKSTPPHSLGPKLKRLSPNKRGYNPALFWVLSVSC